MNGLAELLLECDARGIRLLSAGAGGLTIDAPKDALTPDLIDRLKARKADLLAMLRSSGTADGASPVPMADNPRETETRLGPADELVDEVE